MVDKKKRDTKYTKRKEIQNIQNKTKKCFPVLRKRSVHIGFEIQFITDDIMINIIYIIIISFPWHFGLYKPNRSCIYAKEKAKFI